MADAFIQVAPDSTGKKMQTAENTISGNDVHAEAVVLVDQFGVPLLVAVGQALGTQLYGYDYNNLVPKLVQTDGAGKLILSGDTQIPVVLGSGTAGPAQIEDVASVDSDRGIPAMAIRKATPANTSDTDGDYEMLQMDGGKLWVKGPLTDTELRATPVPVSGSFSLPTGAATEAKQDTQITDLGGVTETAPATDTASSGLNGRLQRIAQRLTSLIALLPSSLGGKTAAGSLSVTTATDDPELTLIGGVTETAPASDTASSGLNGRLQRIAQRLTSLISFYDATNTLLPVVGKKLTNATYCPARFTNLGANATLNVKDTPGNVYSLTCYNANAAARYLQLHNTATVPAGSAVPVFSFLVPPSGQIIIGTDFFTNEGCNFATGIAFAFSTARNIYTAATAGDQSTWIQYK